MSWAKVGMKVVCIDDQPLPGSVWNYGDEVTLGAVYTIRNIWNHGPGIVVDFDEKVRSRRGAKEYGLDRLGYLLSRFRPVVTKTMEQDVQMFKRIAETAPSLEDAE